MLTVPAFFCVAMITGQQLDQARLPQRLRRALEGETSATSQVEWTLTWFGGYDDGLVERHITRTAGDTIWESNLGNADGYHPTGFQRLVPQNPTKEQVQQAMVPKVELAGVRNKLIHDGWAWYLPHAERPLSGDAAPIDKALAYLPVPIKSVGLAPRLRSDLDTNPFQIAPRDFEGFDEAAFREEWDRGFPTVTAEWGEGKKLTWHFDDRVGGQPVEAAFYHSGQLSTRSETTYALMGGRWLPKSVRFYERDELSPYKIIDVQRASFDEPWHMQEITPEDIGLLRGTQLLGPEGSEVWSGTEVISAEAFWEQVHMYDMLPDPRIVVLLVEPSGRKPDPQKLEEYLAYLRDTGTKMRAAYVRKHGTEPWLELTHPNKPGEKDEWDVYVDKFIAEHKLPEPAVKRACEVRDSAKKVRNVRRIQNRDEIRKAQREGDKKKLAYYEEVEQRIFDKMLVRPLRKLAEHAPEKSPEPQKPDTP